MWGRGQKMTCPRRVDCRPRRRGDARRPPLGGGTYQGGDACLGGGRFAESSESIRAAVTCALTAPAVVVCVAVAFGSDGTPTDETRGGLIAFYSERDGDSEILMMKDDGSGVQQLTSNRCADDAPALSPDGCFVAFVSERTGNAEIFVLDLADLSVRQLTETPGMESHPDWSPDGTMIAFARYSPGSWSDGDLFVMSCNGDDERQLTMHAGDDRRPVWFADGTRLLFSSNRDGNYEIYEIAIDGSGLRRITNTAMHELFRRPSPDRTQIVYTVGDIVLRRFAVHVMNGDGSDDRTLTEGIHVSGEDPIWTGDGSSIVFQSDRTGNFEIFIMNADGTEQTNLTHMPSGEYWPTWAPAPIND